MRYRLLGSLLVLGALGLGTVPAFPANYLQSARSAMQRGDLKTAEIELRNAVRSDPRNGEARYLLARVQLALGNPVAAEQQAKAAQARGYDPRAVIPVLGQSMLSQGHAAELLKTLKPTGKDKAADAEALVMRGAAHASLGQEDKAAASLAKAEQLDPANADAWLADARLALARRDVKGAQDKLAHALAANPHSVRARTLQAQLLAIDKNVPGAIKLLGETIADRPPAIPALLLRANLLVATGKFDAARADDDAVLKLLPGNVEALFLKAVLLHQAGKNQDADNLLDRLEPLFPRLPKGFFLQAAVKENLGQLEQAAASARHYVAAEPDDLNGAKLLAEIEFKLNRPDRAIPALAKLVADGRADAQTYDMLGRAYAATGQTAEASKDFEKAATLAPTNVGVRTQLASTMLQLGRPDAAVTDLEHALTLAPKQPQVGEALFLAALRTGDLDKATAALAKVRAAQGDTPVVRNLTGLLQLAKLDVAGATATFEGIVKQDPTFMPARINLARAQAMAGDKAAFEATLGDILKKTPASEPALTLLSNDLLATGRAPAAVALLEAAHKAAPKDIRLTLRLGDLLIRTGSAQKALDLVKQEAPTGAPGPALLGLQAAAELGLKQLPAARDTLTKLVALEPRALVARRELAALLIQKGDYASARDLIKTGISLFPNDYQLYVDYAMIDYKQSGLATALSTADALRTQNLTFVPLQALRGDLYLAAKQPDAALKAYEAANTTAPSLLLTTRIAAVLQQTGKVDQAMQVLKGWLAKHPDQLQVASVLSGMDIARKNYAEARVYLKQVLAKAPHDPASLNNLAWIDQKLGKLAEARSLAGQAYLLAPSPQTADTLGWILVSANEPAQAVVLLRQAHAGSTDPRIAYHYAVALNATGAKAEAVKLLHVAVASKVKYSEKPDAVTLLDKLTKGS